MTVNGSKDWHMRLASPDSELFKMGVVVSPRGLPLTLKRCVEEIKKRNTEKLDEQTDGKDGGTT